MSVFSSIDEIKDILADARTNNYTLSVSATVMNSDTLVLTSTTVEKSHKRIINNMKKIIEINTNENYIVVESGITWVEILEKLDTLGYTLLTTQSGLTFSVGGSFCGNAHGRKTYIPMVKDTIKEFTFIDGEGDIHTVDERFDVYHAFPGSLGLLGIIVTLKLNIRKVYNVCTKQEIIPYTEKSLDYILSLSQNPTICMINFQTSYFSDIREIILVKHTYNNTPINDKYDSSKYLKDSRWYYTFCVLVLFILSLFSILNAARWKLEKYVSESSITTKCININNAFDNWSKPYNPNFRIIEFFFPRAHYMYCQTTLMELFTKNGMVPLSSGSRIIYEQVPSKGYLRFSSMSSKSNPYMSLVINYIENSNFEKLAKDIRKEIIDKNIHMSYHTVYNFSFSRDDMKFMFPYIDEFKEIKKLYDKNTLFVNDFYFKYLAE